MEADLLNTAYSKESLVFVELAGVPSGQLFPPDVRNLQAEMLGIVGDRPVMRINGHTFVGQYEDTLGTYLIMEKNDVDEQGSKGGESKKSSSQDDSLQYFCKMDKKLVMQPAVLVEKASGPAVQPSTEKAPSPELTEASVAPQKPAAVAPV